MRRPAHLLLPAVLLHSCLASWDLPEQDAITLSGAELARRNVQATDTTHVIQNITACPDVSGGGCVSVSFTLDGWDPVQNIGYEYVSENDPDFG